MGKYDDILHLPHYQSPTRAHMSLYDRAAQFAPFAALTGHGDAIRETARLTESRIELTESEKAELDLRLQLLADHLPDRPEVTFTHFRADLRKEGGAYVKSTGVARKINTYARTIVMQSGECIAVDDIISMESSLFRTLDDGF